MSSTFQLGALAGPLLAGALIGAAGNGIAFAVNAASYGGSITALLLVRRRAAAHPRQQPAGRPGPASRRPALRRAHSRVRWTVVLVGTFGVFIMSLPVTLAAFADTVLDSAPAATGCSTRSSPPQVAHRRATVRATGPTQPPAHLVSIAAGLCVATTLAAAAPAAWAFLPLLAALGVATCCS